MHDFATSYVSIDKVVVEEC